MALFEHPRKTRGNEGYMQGSGKEKRPKKKRLIINRL
jgi:hypothetical protein